MDDTLNGYDPVAPSVSRPRRSHSGFDPTPHIERLKGDGYTIVEGFLDEAGLDAFRTGLAPFVGAHRGRNPFEGQTTERVYTLIARSKLFEQIAADPRLLAILDAFLLRGYLLSASHSICIHPGEVPQSLHFDDAFYRVPRPRAAISMSVIGAIDAFSADNGGTLIIPRSHTWGQDDVDAVRKASEAGERHRLMTDMFSLEIPAGAIAIFHGTLVHGAGANVSGAARLSFTNQYCEPWARPQENFFLSVPRERVREMSPEARTLLGYEIFPPFMGHVTATHPAKSLAPGWAPPMVRQARD